MTTRRTFFRTGALLGATIVAPRPLLAWVGRAPEPVPPIEDPRLRELVQRALDAARSAGATYADVRLTHTRSRQVRVTPDPNSSDTERMHVGVRALVNGYWGFATSPLWHPDEVARLGRAAVAQARVNMLAKPRAIDLAPAPIVRDGHWEMPISTNAFDIYPIQFIDYLQGLAVFTRRFLGASASQNFAMFNTQDKAFGSTAGSYCTQRTYLSYGVLEITVMNSRTSERVVRQVETLSPAGVGAELYDGKSIRNEIRRVYDDIQADFALPVKPVDVNRYDVIIDAGGISRLVSSTVGAATELDRAMGYEANATGTSYLNAPSDMLGTFQVGGATLNVSANRDERGGAATVQWDDDGVVPQSYSLVRDGVLQGYQTTRESASWLNRGGVTSTGAAYAGDASQAPLTHTANLTVAPGVGEENLDSMVAGMAKGVLFRGFGVNMDFQQLNGLGFGLAYDIKNGKRAARLSAAATLFRAPELWRSLQVLGGAASAQRFGQYAWKGEPAQDNYHSVTAVPALFKDVSVVDPLRKA